MLKSLRETFAAEIRSGGKECVRVGVCVHRLTVSANI